MFSKNGKTWLQLYVLQWQTGNWIENNDTSTQYQLPLPLTQQKTSATILILNENSGLAFLGVFCLFASLSWSFSTT